MSSDISTANILPSRLRSGRVVKPFTPPSKPKKEKVVDPFDFSVEKKVDDMEEKEVVTPQKKPKVVDPFDFTETDEKVKEASRKLVPPPAPRKVKEEKQVIPEDIEVVKLMKEATSCAEKFILLFLMGNMDTRRINLCSKERVKYAKERLHNLLAEFDLIDERLSKISLPIRDKYVQHRFYAMKTILSFEKHFISKQMSYYNGIKEGQPSVYDDRIEENFPIFDIHANLMLKYLNGAPIMKKEWKQGKKMYHDVKQLLNDVTADFDDLKKNASWRSVVNSVLLLEYGVRQFHRLFNAIYKYDNNKQ